MIIYVDACFFDFVFSVGVSLTIVKDFLAESTPSFLVLDVPIPLLAGCIQYSGSCDGSCDFVCLRLSVDYEGFRIVINIRSNQNKLHRNQESV
jgi:hypothetical protein